MDDSLENILKSVSQQYLKECDDFIIIRLSDIQIESRVHYFSER